MHGRNIPEFGGASEWDDRQVDPHKYLRGKERAPVDPEDILGRRPHDAQKLFPKFTTATVTTTGQVEVNGKTVPLWTFQQLEPLAVTALRQRACNLRDALGEGCPPIGSTQKQDLIRWIIERQSEITGQALHSGCTWATGGADSVPKSFLHEAKVARDRESQPRTCGSPNRTAHCYPGTYDHIYDLHNGIGDVEEELRKGIVSSRLGGEGKKHLQPAVHMDGFGLSAVDKDPARQRRYLGCDDHLMRQQKELEAGMEKIASIHHGIAVRGSAAGGWAHPSDSSLVDYGIPIEAEVSPVTGQRKKHGEGHTQDHMVGVGMSDPGAAESHIPARRRLDEFTGARFAQSEESSGYHSTWRKDPSRLRGTSMIC